MPSETGAPSRWAHIEPLLRGLILTVVLVLPCVLGLITTYVFIPVAVVATAYLLLARNVDWTPDTTARVLGSAFVALAIVFAITADEPSDPLAVFNFIALPIYWPLSVLMRRGSGMENGLNAARLSLAGATGGLLFCLAALVVLGTMQAEFSFTDYIRVANTAVILGFMSAAMGYPLSGRRLRWLFLLGPLVALAVVLISGARIAMVAYLVLIVLLPLLLIERKRVAIATAFGLLAVVVIFGLAIGGDRVQALTAVLGELATRGSASDHAVGARLAIYQAGWQAFLAAPFLGYGWANMMPAAATYLSDADKVHGLLPHLHNEVLNFAVFGGIIGVGLYLVLMAGPILIAGHGHDVASISRRNGVIVVIAAYVVMGLTDTMVSFELHTALYVGLLAILFGWCGRPSVPARG